jgi:hypothetical protein
MNASSSPAPPLRNQASRQPNRRTSFWMWTTFSLSAIAAIGLLLIPAFVIRPFTHQSPGPLWLAMALRQRAPLGTLIAGLACLIFVFVLWRTVGRWRKSLLALTLLMVIFSTVMSRLNYFEWMFHPIAGAQFVAQAQSKLDPKEMILAVNLGGEARAYPISQMAYHHVLNDVVAGVPIAVTY